MAYKSGRGRWLERLPSSMPVFWELQILESQVCSDMPNKWEQNWHQYFNTILFSQHTYLTRIKFHFMLIFLTLTSVSYVHQNKICIFVMNQVVCYMYHKWFSCKAVRLLGQLLKVHSDWGFCKDQRILLQMDPKDVPICYDFALLFYEQKEQKKLIKYSLVIGSLLGNPLGSVESRMSFKNPLAHP